VFIVRNTLAERKMHMAQLMPLPITVSCFSCFSKVQIGFTFLVPAHLGSPGHRTVKEVCVCVCVLNIKPDDINHPDPILHLILNRHQVIPIQCASVYFCMAKDRR